MDTINFGRQAHNLLARGIAAVENLAEQVGRVAEALEAANEEQRDNDE